MLKQFSAWDAGILLIGSIFPLDCVVIPMDLLLDCTHYSGMLPPSLSLLPPSLKAKITMVF